MNCLDKNVQVDWLNLWYRFIGKCSLFLIQGYGKISRELEQLYGRPWPQTGLLENTRGRIRNVLKVICRCRVHIRTCSVQSKVQTRTRETRFNRPSST